MLATDDELKELIVKRLGLIDEAEFEKIRVVAARLRIPVDRALAERGVIPISFLLRELARTGAWASSTSRWLTSSPMRSAPFPRNTRAARLVIPIEKKDRELRLAMHNPRDKKAIAQIEQMTGLKVVPFLAAGDVDPAGAPALSGEHSRSAGALRRGGGRAGDPGGR